MFQVYHSNQLDLLKDLLVAFMQQTPLEDPFADTPAPLSLSNGFVTIVATMVSANNSPGWTITASTTSGVLYASTVTSVMPVRADTATRLQVLLPGETAVPGSSTGKDGVPDSGGEGKNAA